MATVMGTAAATAMAMVMAIIISNNDSTARAITTLMGTETEGGQPQQQPQ